MGGKNKTILLVVRVYSKMTNNLRSNVILNDFVGKQINLQKQSDIIIQLGAHNIHYKLPNL